MTRWPYKSGDHLVVCDICGGRLYSSQSKKNWEGLVCHPNCCDPRHPQELIRAKKERITVKDSRPEGTDVFLSPGDVTPEDL